MTSFLVFVRSTAVVIRFHTLTAHPPMILHGAGPRLWDRHQVVRAGPPEPAPLWRHAGMHAGARLRVKSPGDPPTGLDHTPRRLRPRATCRSQTGPSGEAIGTPLSWALPPTGPLLYEERRVLLVCDRTIFTSIHARTARGGVSVHVPPQEMGAYLQVEVTPYSMDRSACC